MAAIDSQFFEKIVCKQQGNKEYEAYKATYARSTMVLFSKKTKTPLAALVFHAQDRGVLSLLTARPPPAPHGASSPGSTEVYFQGMLNMPDQEFTFTIVNLNETGMINFNVLHTPHRVSEVDPGPAFGVNKVNELHAGQAYTITADQRTNRAMVLQGLTEKKSATDATLVSVSVDQAEAKATRQGLFFYLSVVPQNTCESLVQKFKEGTKWECVPYFVRCVDARRFISKGRGGGNIGSFGDEEVFFELGSSRGGGGMMGLPQGDLRQRGAIPDGSARESSLNLQNEEAYIRGPPRGAVHAMALSDAPNTRELQRSFVPRSVAASLDKILERSDHLAVPAAMSLSAVRDPPRAEFASDSMGIEDEDMLFSAGIARESWQRAEVATVQSAASASHPPGNATRPSGLASHPSGNATRELFSPVQIGSTQAGSLGYGRDVQVQSGFTGVDYDYTCPSDPAVLCLSLHPTIKFSALPDLQGLAAADIEDFIHNAGKSLLAALEAIYKSDFCCIDLESPADVVIAQCGHQCINAKNTGSITKCPLCRRHVDAFISASGLVVA